MIKLIPIFKAISENLSKLIVRFAVLFSIFAIVFSAVPAQAQSSCQVYNPNLPNFGLNCIPLLKNFQSDRAGVTNIIIRVADYAIFVLGAIGVLMIVYAGFLFITDGGSGERATKGRKIIFNVIIGIIIAVASYTIVTFVSGFISTLDINNLNSTTTNNSSGI